MKQAQLKSGDYYKQGMINEMPRSFVFKVKVNFTSRDKKGAL